MVWFTRKSKATEETYSAAGAAALVQVYQRLGLSPDDRGHYTDEECKAIAEFQDAFIAWGKRQVPPLFAFNATGQIFCPPGLESPSLSLQGFVISAALQNLYRSDAYKNKGAQQRLATASRAWMAYMNSSVLHDMIPMLAELGWVDEVREVSQVLSRFPPFDSNEKFLSLCKSFIVLEKDPPPGF